MSAPLVLVPGLNCTARLFLPQIAALGAGRTVIVPDTTAGDSIAALTESILADLPARFALAGLSMGGYIAFEIWRRASERVERLALLDTTARPDTPEAANVRRDAIALAGSGQFDRVVTASLPRLLGPASLADPEMAATVRAMAKAIGPQAYCRQQTAIMGRVDSRPTLATISVPTLVLVGEDDALTPPELAREMNAGIAGSRLSVVPSCGHLSTIESSDDVTEEMRVWLNW